MRKSVLFAIGIVYLVSIVVVTFFGLQLRMDQFQVYMESINITSYDKIRNGDKYLYLSFDETEGYKSVFITFDYSPEEASYPEKVEFSLSGNSYEEDGQIKYFAEISQRGELVFFEKGMVIVTVATTDGSKISDKIKVFCT
ncbi:MAG: hypothetical protein IJS74_03605 [Clostridia bacterium]|nr:hypothetical protein [Clostridia bacterium]